MRVGEKGANIQEALERHTEREALSRHKHDVK